MALLEFDDNFKRTFCKIKDMSVRERIEKLIIKIKNNPEIGKPMMHNRKGTREVYLPPFRLSYAYDKIRDVLIILDFYHKDEQ